MHPNDASGSHPAAPDDVVTRIALDADGVLRVGADPHARALRATVGALRAALAGTVGAHVVLAPAGATAPAAPAVDEPASATARPVTDAVKQVADGLLVRTVDRGPLRWVTTPAVVPRAALEAALAGRADDDVVEPLALVGPLEVRP